MFKEKEKYYCMEALVKEDHQVDHLEVGFKTPSGKVYEVIPSQFLWATLKYQKGQHTLFLCF